MYHFSAKGDNSGAIKGIITKLELDLCIVGNIV